MSDRIDNAEQNIEVEDFFVSVSGHRLAARRLVPAGSDADAPWLVFLHEALGSIGQWRRVPALLAGRLGLPALVYERRGFGRSDPLELPQPLDYLDREAEVVLPQVLAACGIERPLPIGHSDGATIALLYAAAFPDRPLALVSEAGHVFVDEMVHAGVRAAVGSWPGRLREGLQRYHGDRAQTLFRAWSETWLSPAFASWNIEGRLAAIRCPLLAIQGEDDQYGTLRQLDAIAGLTGGPSERLLLPDCGHVPHHEAREVTLTAIERFVREALGRA